ncbi:MAG: serine hydrolase domain-containing protein, partial [Pseudomonadota bacterium]
MFDRSSAQFGMAACALFLLTGCQPQPEHVASPTASAPSDATSLHAQLFEKIDAAIETEMQDNHIPGVAVVLVQGGETIYKKGYGVANIETGAPVDPDTTIFRIGSTSKALSLLALTRLIDDARVSRTDDVSDYFAEIENPIGYTDPVQVEHLLTHTTGFDQIGYGRQLGGFEYSISERQAARPSLSEFLGDRNLRRINPP